MLLNPGLQLAYRAYCKTTKALAWTIFDNSHPLHFLRTLAPVVVRRVAVLRIVSPRGSS